MEVVDALAPLVGEKRRRFRVGRLDPSREKSPLVRLVPEILVEIGVCHLLQRLDIVDRNEMSVQVHELDTNFLNIF